MHVDRKNVKYCKLPTWSQDYFPLNGAAFSVKGAGVEPGK